MSMQERTDIDIRLTILTDRSREDLAKDLRDDLAKLFGDGEGRILADGEYLVQLIVNAKKYDVPIEFLWNKKPIESMSKEELIASLRTIGSTIELEVKRSMRQVVRRLIKGSDS